MWDIHAGCLCGTPTRNTAQNFYLLPFTRAHYIKEMIILRDISRILPVFSFFLFSIVLVYPALGGALPEGDKAVAKVDARGVYLQWCAQCHGAKGEGDGVNSTRDMAINPRDHTDELFMVTRTDAQFEEVILEGGPGVAKSPLMPPWKNTLTAVEVRALVVYMRELCNCEFEGVVSHKKLRHVDTDFR